MSKDDATERKLRQLQDRQARWMRERAAHNERSEVEAELQRERADAPLRPSTSEPAERRGPHPASPQQQPQRQRASAGQPFSENHHFKPEEVITRLTERITDRLRDELRIEIQNETSRAAAAHEAESGKLEGYLASEIESYSCPICYEQMVPPVNQPILLFPCGHSFCARCITAHTEKHRKTSCPFCREKITSKAPNMALQQLIQNYSAKRDKIRSGEPAFELTGPSATSGAAGPLRGAAHAEEDDPARWERELRMLEMRCRVLQNELADTHAERKRQEGNIASAAVVLQMFRQEQEQARTKLEAAQREMAMVEEQVEAQGRKLEQYHSARDDSDSKADLILRTLEPLQAEAEKLEMLLSELGGHR